MADIIAPNCDACPFKGIRIGSRGNPQAPIVLVGEGPANDEIRVNKLLVGPVGKLLEKCLPAGFTLDDFYIVNAIQCLPKSKTPQAKMAAAKCCQQRLLSEIAQYPRKMVIALGGIALNSLTNDFTLKITTVRGHKFPFPHSELGIMATIHPAFILRGGGNIKHLKQDLEDAITEANGTSTRNYIDPEYRVISSPEGLEKLNRIIRKQPFVGADIETSGFSQFTDRILSIGIGWDPKVTYIVEGENIWKLKEAFEDPNVHWIWHNGKFDIKFMREPRCTNGGIHARVDEDTMLLNYTLDETSNSNDLGSVAIGLLGCPDWKAELDAMKPSKKASYDTIAKPILYSYQAKDVSYMIQSFEILRPRVAADKHCEKLYTKTLIPASEMLTNVERRGMLVDEPWRKRQHIRLENEITVLKEEINQIVGYSINPNSSAQVCKYVYDTLRIKAKERSTDAKIVANWPDMPFKKALQKYRKVAKALSTYVIGYARFIEPSDGRIHPTFKLHRTPTGRLACGEPNLQNIPRDPQLKGMYHAPEGYVYLEVDYSQAELRSLAVQSGDKELLRIFNTPGLSLHKEVAIARYGKDYTPDQYVRAKAVNFGIAYGREAYSIAEEFGIPVREAQSIIDAWFARFPQAKEFIDRCRGTVVKGQTMITAFGRKKRAKYPSQEMLRNLQNEAANFPHQSTASDCTLQTAIRIQPLLVQQWNAYIVDLVHDSMVIECPNNPEAIKSVGDFVAAEMQKTPELWGIYGAPFIADVKQSINWGNSADKD